MELWGRQSPITLNFNEGNERMIVIYKYKLELEDTQTLDIHLGAKFLKVERQGSGYYVWALHDTNRPSAPRKIKVIGTSNSISDDIWAYDYIGSIMDAPFVWHVFGQPV